MVIPIFNNNPRAPMRDNVTRSKTTYSTRNAGGDGTGEETRVCTSLAVRGPGAHGPDHCGYS
jgi:DNA excision repair protein ERCC-4